LLLKYSAHYKVSLLYYNLLESHSGTLFQGAAKSTLVDTDEYLLQVIRYVHANPVSAKLVGVASDWEFSDCSVWVGDSDALFPGKSIRDEWFKDGKGYREFLEAYEPGTLAWYPFKGSGLNLGPLFQR
jgi:hypothetical protein